MKMIFREIGCVGVDSVQPVRDNIQYWAVVNTVKSLQVPQNRGFPYHLDNYQYFEEYNL
jgi:hypothetical protein